jgi:hypothetical protein
MLNLEQMFIWTLSILCIKKWTCLNVSESFYRLTRFITFWTEISLSVTITLFIVIILLAVVSLQRCDGRKARKIFSRFGPLKASESMLSQSLFYFHICIKFFPPFNITLYFLRSQRKSFQMPLNLPEIPSGFPYYSFLTTGTHGKLGQAFPQTITSIIVYVGI